MNKLTEQHVNRGPWGKTKCTTEWGVNLLYVYIGSSIMSHWDSVFLGFQDQQYSISDKWWSFQSHTGCCHAWFVPSYVPSCCISPLMCPFMLEPWLTHVASSVLVSSTSRPVFTMPVLSILSTLTSDTLEADRSTPLSTMSTPTSGALEADRLTPLCCAPARNRQCVYVRKASIGTHSCHTCPFWILCTTGWESISTFPLAETRWRTHINMK